MSCGEVSAIGIGQRVANHASLVDKFHAVALVVIADLALVRVLRARRLQLRIVNEAASDVMRLISISEAQIFSSKQLLAKVHGRSVWLSVPTTWIGFTGALDALDVGLSTLKITEFFGTFDAVLARLVAGRDVLIEIRQATANCRVFV